MLLSIPDLHGGAANPRVIARKSTVSFAAMTK